MYGVMRGLSEHRPSLISLIYLTSCTGYCPKIFQGVQLELFQSAVVKPPFDREHIDLTIVSARI